MSYSRSAKASLLLSQSASSTAVIGRLVFSSEQENARSVCETELTSTADENPRPSSAPNLTSHVQLGVEWGLMPTLSLQRLTMHLFSFSLKESASPAQRLPVLSEGNATKQLEKNLRRRQSGTVSIALNWFRLPSASFWRSRSLHEELQLVRATPSIRLLSDSASLDGTEVSLRQCTR